MTKKCTACGAMWYCSRDHQRSHWKAHKVECRGGKAKGGSVGKGPSGRAGTAAAPEEKDARDGGGGDPGEQTATEARYAGLGAMMKMGGDRFDINKTVVGSGVEALWFALGEPGDPYDEKAVKLVLGVPGLDVNVTGSTGATVLCIQ